MKKIARQLTRVSTPPGTGPQAEATAPPIAHTATRLAGISIEYYTRIERGSIRGVSDDVLDALARALHLDDVERAHLADLVHAANAPPRGSRRGAARDQVRPSVQRLPDSMTGAAAFVRNARLDILPANHLGYALSPPAFPGPARPVNLAGSSSWTAAPPSSTATGTASPATPSAACAPRPPATPATRR